MKELQKSNITTVTSHHLLLPLKMLITDVGNDSFKP